MTYNAYNGIADRIYDCIKDRDADFINHEYFRCSLKYIIITDSIPFLTSEYAKIDYLVAAITKYLSSYYEEKHRFPPAMKIAITLQITCKVIGKSIE